MSQSSLTLDDDAVDSLVETREVESLPDLASFFSSLKLDSYLIVYNGRIVRRLLIGSGEMIFCKDDDANDNDRDA